MNKQIILNNEFQKIAHEVKNPLTICKGYIEMIRKEGMNKNYLDIIRDELNRSIMLLTDYMILDNKKVNISSLLKDVVDILNPYFKKNNSKIIVKCSNKYNLIGDYNKLKQIIINLIKNAYEAKGIDKLIVVIDVIENKDGYFIKVIDNGVGMSSECLSKIKKDYYTTKDDGIGLGLSFIEDSIKLYGGYVKYYSIFNIGTRVEVYIPKKSPRTFNSSNYY